MSVPLTTDDMVTAETRLRLGLLTEEQLAATLKVTPGTLEVWRGQGKGPDHVKLGRGVFYRIADVKDWIARAGTNVETIEFKDVELATGE